MENLRQNIKLPTKFFHAFRAKMQVEYNIYLSEEQINEIWLFFDCVKDVEFQIDPYLEQMIFVVEGKTYRFDKNCSNLIDKLRLLPSELRIRAMNITIVEMEKYIQVERDSILSKLKKMFANKKYRWRETGDIMNWREMFEYCYSDYEFVEKTTTRKILADIKTGKLTIDFAIELRKRLLEAVYV